jgi:hypothetical protein
MKIDIEGADRHCLSLLHQFEDRPAYLSIEANKTDWQELRREFAALDSLGYDMYSVVQQENIGGTTLTSTTLDGRRLAFQMEPSASGPFGDYLARWETRGGAMHRFRAIFLLYRLFGDNGVVHGSVLGRRVTSRLSRVLRVPLPGWYDIHARHRSA